MKDMLQFRYQFVMFVLIIAGFLFSCGERRPPKPAILLITGGHDFDTAELFDLFKSFEGYNTDTLSQPYANQFIGSGKAQKYDVLVFYDSWQIISETEKQAYLDLAEKGTGFLFLHHSLVSYQGWDEFSKIRGGRYHKSNPPDSIADSQFRHDIDLSVTICDSIHPITRDINTFIIHDEGYSNIIVKDGVTPLLKTINPFCAEIIAWTNEYRRSRIVYLMGGHDRKAYENYYYRQLIINSLDYLIQEK